ncbi:MAG TPA: PEP-CTERM sorting domain-containing protein [Chthoniobacterales bacterium]|nr:PEP-CTERM sorting domain-containing protein [Chthoniobacterales bacterium]
MKTPNFVPQLLGTIRAKTITAALAVVALASSASAAGTFYTTEASFTLALNPVFYLEDFSSFTFGSPLNGTQPTYVAPGANGYGWTAAAALNLYSNISALSTNSANDPITLTFSGLSVTAFGGIFSNTDISGAFIPGTITVTTSDGGVEVLSIPTSPGSFIGYTSAVPIVSMVMSATSGATNNWIQVDHFYTGAAIPEPGTMALLTLGVVGLAGAAIKRRRRS